MSRPIVKYALLQVPGLVLFALVLFLLKDWLSIPLWLVILLILLWIAKDAALYPLMRHAYGTSEGDRAQSMVGRKGIVKERLDPSGYIELDNELWHAEIRHGSAPIEAGTQVQVKKRNGLTLVVEPAEDEA